MAGLILCGLWHPLQETEESRSETQRRAMRLRPIRLTVNSFPLVVRGAPRRLHVADLAARRQDAVVGGRVWREGPLNDSMRGRSLRPFLIAPAARHRDRRAHGSSAIPLKHYLHYASSDLVLVQPGL